MELIYIAHEGCREVAWVTDNETYLLLSEALRRERGEILFGPSNRTTTSKRNSGRETKMQRLMRELEL